VNWLLNATYTSLLSYSTLVCIIKKKRKKKEKKIQVENDFIDGKKSKIVISLEK